MGLTRRLARPEAAWEAGLWSLPLCPDAGISEGQVWRQTMGLALGPWLRFVSLSAEVQAEKMKHLPLSKTPVGLEVAKTEVCGVLRVHLRAAFAFLIPVLRLSKRFRYWAVEALRKWLARLRPVLCSGDPCPTWVAAAQRGQTQAQPMRPETWGLSGGGRWSNRQDAFPDGRGAHVCGMVNSTRPTLPR